MSDIGNIITVVFACVSLFGLYPSTGFVVDVDRVNDTVLVETSQGYTWEIEGAEDWEIGDGCSLIFHDNGTGNIEDDVIVSARYSGWTYGLS